MKEQLARFFKNTPKSRIWYLAFVLALGVALMLMGGYGGGFERAVNVSGKKEDANTSLPTETPDSPSISDYERSLEERLEKTLSGVQGVGQVRVMLTVSTRDEVTLAQDVSYENRFEPSENGRTVQTEKRDSKYVIITDRDGRDAPIVTKRSEPEIEGAVIVAEGGGSAEVKASLTRAAAALLNLPSHKIEVLKLDLRK